MNDDELKAIYHSNDCVCIWIFKTQKEIFLDETAGMKKESEKHFSDHYTFLVTN